MKFINKNNWLNLFATVCIFSPLMIRPIFGAFYLSSFFAGGLCMYGWQLLGKVDEEETKKRVAKFEKGKKKQKVALLLSVLNEVAKKKKS